MVESLQEGQCYICKETTQVGYCGFCKHWFCTSCRKKYPKRMAMAMEELSGKVRKGFSGFVERHALVRKTKRLILKSVFIQWQRKEYGLIHFERMLKLKFAVLAASLVLMAALLSMGSEFGHSVYLFIPAVSFEGWLPKDFGEIWNLWDDPIALDGHKFNGCGQAASCDAAITTTTANDVLVLQVNFGNAILGTTSVTDNLGSHLTWTKRTSNSVASRSIEVWYSVWTSSGAITITWSSTLGTNFISVIGIGISGATTGNCGSGGNSCFDSNVALPALGQGNSATASVSVTTSNANDMLLALNVDDGTTTPTVGACCTMADAGSTTVDGGLEYKIVSATQSGLALTQGINGGGGAHWTIIGDAIMQAASAVALNTMRLTNGMTLTGRAFVFTNG